MIASNNKIRDKKWQNWGSLCDTEMGRHTAVDISASLVAVPWLEINPYMKNERLIGEIRKGEGEGAT